MNALNRFKLNKLKREAPPLHAALSSAAPNPLADALLMELPTVIVFITIGYYY